MVYEIMGIILKKVTINDAEELLQIYAPYVEDTAITFEYDVPTVEEFRNRIKDISSKYPYIKAVDDNGNILGYAYAASFKGRKAYDWSCEVTIYLRMDERGKGLGKILYSKLEKSLKDMGILNMNACITYPKSENIYVNYDSFNFHKKLGFNLVGKFTDSGFKFNEWFDMVWMEKMIGDHTNDTKPVKFGKWDI